MSDSDQAAYMRMLIAVAQVIEDKLMTRSDFKGKYDDLVARLSRIESGIRQIRKSQEP